MNNNQTQNEINTVRIDKQFLDELKERLPNGATQRILVAMDGKISSIRTIQKILNGELSDSHGVIKMAVEIVEASIKEKKELEDRVKRLKRNKNA